jgi:integrase
MQKSMSLELCQEGACQAGKKAPAKVMPKSGKLPAGVELLPSGRFRARVRQGDLNVRQQFDTLADAVAWRDAVLAGARVAPAAEAERATPSITLATAFNHVLAKPAPRGYAGQAQERNVATYMARMLEYFGDDFDVLAVKHASILTKRGEKTIDGLITWLREARDITNGTINHHLTCLSKTLRVVYDDLDINVRRPRVIREQPDAEARDELTAEDGERVVTWLRTMDGQRSTGTETYRFAADFVAVLQRTGMRCSEAFALRACDLDFGGRKITVAGEDGKGTKNGDTRVLDMSPTVHDILHRRSGGAAFAPFTDRAYTAVRNAFDDAVAALGIKGNVSLHSTRHHFCSEMMRKTNDPITVSMFSGHRDLNTLRRYSHNPDNIMGTIFD